MLAPASLGLHRGVGEVPMCLRRLGGRGGGSGVFFPTTAFSQFPRPVLHFEFKPLSAGRVALEREGACVSVSVPVRPYPLNCPRVLAEEPGSVTTKRESDVVSIWFLLHMGLVKIC